MGNTVFTVESEMWIYIGEKFKHDFRNFAVILLNFLILVNR